MNYLWHLCIVGSVYAMLSISLDVLVGHLGLLVLCQSAFFAVGAYTYAIMTLKFGMPISLAIAAGVLLSAVISIGMSTVARRLRADAVVLASFSLLLLLGDLLKNLRELTGGLDGLADIPTFMGEGPNLLGLPWQAGISIVLFGFCLAITLSFTRGPYGHYLHALRDDTHAAVGIGVQPLQVYARSFGVAGSIAGISGVVYASYASYINPNIFGADTSILLMAMVLIGGAATRIGPILGTVILLTIPEVIRLSGGGAATIGSLNYIVMGSILIAFATLRPRGILGGYEFK